MKHRRSTIQKMIAIFVIVSFIMACGISSPTNATPTPTIIGAGADTLPPGSNPCEGLSGYLEMQVLVGPAEAVGLEPFALGKIPFSVVSEEGTNTVQGSGSITYEDVLEKEWGTYTVMFDSEALVSGECVGDDQIGTLNMTIEIQGEQMVEVIAEGFQGDYPWKGSHEFNLSFPIEEGASAEGGEWRFVLHLNE